MRENRNHYKETVQSTSLNLQGNAGMAFNGFWV